MRIGLNEIAVRGSMSQRAMKSLLRTAALFVFLAGVCAASTERLTIPEYRVGDKAERDVIAPFPIVAVDADKTAELRSKELPRIPAIFRWDTNAAQRAVAEFKSVIAEEQARFIEALINDYRKASLDERAVNTQRFRKLVNSLQDTNRAFPLTMAIAKTWATNGDDAALLWDVQGQFAEAATLYIRTDQWPANWLSSWQFKAIPGDATNAVTLALADKAKLVLRRTNFFAVGKLRSDFQKKFPRELRPYAKFAASLLRPNCFPEEGLTRELRERRLRGIWSARNYAAGEPIVRAGETVTPLNKLALDELRVRLLAMKAQEAPTRPEWVEPAVAGGAGVILVCAGIVVWSLRRRRAAMLALQVTAPAGISADPAARAQLVEKLTRLLGESFVKRLFVDRTKLLESQGDATAQTQQLEERIETIQTRVQQKYREYEERIAQLEQELATAEEEKRDLIRAKIVLARQELEAERAKHRVDWN
jgi:hypothetical protein